MRHRFHEALNRLRAFRRKQALDRDLDIEMGAHLAFAIEENVQRGLSPEEARCQALLRFGGVAQAKEQNREARGLPALDVLIQDLRYTFRSLQRDRAFALFAVLILGMGVGANIAIFSVVNTLLLRPLPFRTAQQLTWLAGNQGTGSLSDQTYRVDAYEEIARNSQSFRDVTAYVPYYDYSDFKLTGYGEPQLVFGVWVAGNFFQTLGIQPERGRLFAREECIRGGRAAVLLSHEFWQRRFAADPGILGRAVTLNKRSFTIVGVLPETFDFAAVLAPGLKVDFYLAVVMDDIRTWNHTLSIIGRLKPGVTASQAQAEVMLLMSRQRKPEWMTDAKTSVVGLKYHVSGKLRRSLIVLWCGVGLVLLIVYVNLSNLLLARTASRGKEFAMRTALGAGRSRLIRQLMTESLVLAGAGSALGLVFTIATLRYLAHQETMGLPLLSTVSPDAAAIGWTLAIAMVTVLVCGLVPGLAISRGNPQATLKETGRGMSESRKQERMRAALVVSEVTLACVLLIGAGLLMRSFLLVLDVDLGFQPSRAATLKLDYDDGGNRARRGVVLKQIADNVNTIPGVEAVGMSDKLPLDRSRSWNLRAKGRVYPAGWNADALVYIVTPGYLRALGVRLRDGRDFTWRDTPTSEPVIIINQAAAQRDWPNENPIRHLAQRIGDGDTRVVGVISDVRQRSVEESAGPEVYVPATQAEPDGENLVVRTTLPPGALASSVLRKLRELNPGQPAVEFRPLQQFVERAVSPRRFFVSLVACFAGLGLMLASLGIYGVVSYSVTRRTQELSIRMAMGATAGQVEFGVIWTTLRLAFIGIGLGTIASVASSRVISSLLFGTEPTDIVVFGAMIFLLSAVAFLAGYLPARRISRIDPIVGLRAN